MNDSFQSKLFLFIIKEYFVSGLDIHVLILLAMWFRELISANEFHTDLT